MFRFCVPQLSEFSYQEDLRVILRQQTSKILDAVQHIHHKQNHFPYLWSFLDSAITSSHHGLLLQTAECAVGVVKELCKLVTGWVSGSAVDKNDEEEVTCGHILSILGTLDSSLAEVILETVHGCIYNVY